jgi:hypothetical protein
VLAEDYLAAVRDASALLSDLLADESAAAPLAEQWAALVHVTLNGAALSAGRRRVLTHTLADFIHGYAMAPAVRDRRGFRQSVRLIVDGALSSNDT